jgi:hypothetical protein
MGVILGHIKTPNQASYVLSYELGKPRIKKAKGGESG